MDMGTIYSYWCHKLEALKAKVVKTINLFL